MSEKDRPDLYEMLAAASSDVIPHPTEVAEALYTMLSWGMCEDNAADIERAATLLGLGAMFAVGETEKALNEATGNRVSDGARRAITVAMANSVAIFRDIIDAQRIIADFPADVAEITGSPDV